jgi:hypothetical protein
LAVLRLITSSPDANTLRHWRWPLWLPTPIATAHNSRNLGIGLALQRGEVRHLNMVEMTAPQPPVGFTGARPRLRCAHREVPFVFLRENLAIERPSGKVTEAAIHKQVRPSGSALARSPPLSGAFQAWEWGSTTPMP